MPETTKEHFKAINDLGDRLRVRFTRDAGAVTGFTVQYEALINGDYVPIARYDCAHGFAHRDDLDRRGQTIMKTPMEPHTTYNDAMTAAINDLATNWERYLDEFQRRRS